MRFFFVPGMLVVVRPEILLAVRMAVPGIRGMFMGVGVFMSMPVCVFMPMLVGMLGSVLMGMIMFMLVLVGMVMIVAVLVVTFHRVSPLLNVTRISPVDLSSIGAAFFLLQEAGFAQRDHPAIE
jgi:hypothetical protein